MTEHALAARVQRLRLQEDATAADVVEEIRALGVVKPERMLSIHAPGFLRAP